MFSIELRAGYNLNNITHVFSLQLRSPVLLAVILISGIGGTFQYGFNISVLNSPSVFIKNLVNSTCQQRYGRSLEPWELTLIWSFIVSIYCIGGLIGTLSAGRLAAVYGRKKTLLLNNVVAICGAVLMLLSKTTLSFEMIIVGRIVYGINAGVSLIVHTLYILECAPKRLRGMVGVSVASFVSLGKFSGQLLGISELLGTEERWIWLLAFSGVTGLLQLLTLPFFPESPRYLLLERADRHGCEMALRRLWGATKDPKPEMEDMLAEDAALKGVKIHRLMDLFLDVNVRWQLLTVIVTFVTLQLCGINAVYLYSFDVFQAAGIPNENLHYAALGTGLCEISTSIACVLIIESTGKKVLLFRGYLGMAAALALLTITLYLQEFVSWMSYCSMVLICIYILFFSTGPAAVTAPLPGEIFTQSYKPAAFTVAGTLNWVGLFLVGMLFPLIVKHLDYFCFLIFFVFCFFSGVFVWFNVPETKNKTVLEITEDFNKMHQKPRRSLESKLSSVHINDIQAAVSTKL
ncbi:solute carrier family 2 member 11, like [Triplophysa rosa]|uniref:solute carrier family 2 member 11, like n=1 Tax=Triplophysa rosa TaxID=992332 RepID=UPI002545EADF|nr:solute carrier family 2 member 11, like [Triplophysa rosa]